jgi:uncharacterized protein (TIGR03435 family)
MALERPVVNQTGLNGEYEVHLKWAPESGIDNTLPGEPAGPTDPDAALASIFTGIQSELGLRLKATRGLPTSSKFWMQDGHRKTRWGAFACQFLIRA